MGVDQVRDNSPIRTSGVSVMGNNGEKLTKEEAKLAQIIAGLDGKALLSRSDLTKLKQMKPAEQMAYINKALQGTGYKVAEVYDCEMDEKSSGITWTSDGLFINFSKGGKTINVDQMGSTGGNTGHLSITFK